MFKLIPTVKVGNTTVSHMYVGTYENNRLAVQVYSIVPEQDGGDGIETEPWDTLSVNLPDQKLKDENTFFARNYSYHESTFQAFVDAGYLKIESGSGNVGNHGNCCVCSLTEKAKENPL